MLAFCACTGGGQVVSDINYVQSEAIAHQEPKAILFYPSENRYVLLDMPGGTVDPSRYAFQNTRFNTSGMGDANIDSSAHSPILSQRQPV